MPQISAPALAPVIRAVCDGAEIKGIWFGTSYIWPDPWTDIWEEGGAKPVWQNEWRNMWSESYPEIAP